MINVYHTTDDIHQLVNSCQDRKRLLEILNCVEILESKSMKKSSDITQEIYHYLLTGNHIHDSFVRYLYNASTTQRFNLIRLALERIEYLDKLQDAASPRIRQFTNILPLKDN